MEKNNKNVNEIPFGLVINRLCGNETIESAALLDSWLIDESNREVYVTLTSLWEALMREGMNYKSAADELWKRQETVLSAGKASQIESIYTSGNSVVFHHETNGVPLKKGIQISFSRAKFRWAVAAASVLFLISLSVSVYFAKEWHDTGMSTQHYASISGKSKFVLPDGSSVWLNAGGVLDYEYDVFNHRRSVHLEGEACFDVTHDMMRPFVVESRGFEVLVHGTKFNVDARTNHENIDVSLIAGSVSVSSQDFQKDLIPGEHAVCNKKTGTIAVNKSDVDFAAFWAKESIRFEHKSIRELVKYLSKWYGVEINLDPKVPNDQAYTFTIKGEPLEEILRLMARINPIKYNFDENNKVSIYRKY